MVVDFKEILNDFKTQLEAIEKDNTSILDCARNTIILSRNILHTFKKEIEANGFKSNEQEIEFFKCTKQIPLVPLIYYSEVRSFELQFPRVNTNSQKKFVKKR